LTIHFLHYANNVMTIWNMLLVVKHRESVDVEPNRRWLLKNFHFYTICNNKSITQITVWLFVSYRVQNCLNCHLLRRLVVTNNTRWAPDWYEAIFYCKASQSSTTTIWVDRCENWETAVRLNHLILWRKRHFRTATYASTHKKFDIDCS